MKCTRCPLQSPCIGEQPEQGFACAMALSGTESELRWIADASAGVEPEPSLEHTPPAAPGPTLLDKAVSLTKAAAAFAASGFDTVDQEEFGRRHGICEACEKFDAERDLCNICGCAMGYKPRMKVAKCPIGKW